MPINTDPSTKKKVVFWNRIYRFALVALILVSSIITVSEVVSVSHKLDQRTQEQSQQLQCIGEYFSRNNRAALKIQNLNQCNIEKIQ